MRPVTRASRYRWYADFTTLAPGSAATLPIGMTIASGASTERTVQTGDSTLVTGITANTGRIGRRTSSEPYALVVEEARTNRWPNARDASVTGTGIATGLGVTYTSSGLAGPDGTGNAKRVQVTSNNYSNYFSISATGSNYAASVWHRGIAGGESFQIFPWAGSGTAYGTGGVLTTSWQRYTARQTSSVGARSVVIVDARDWTSFGGIVQGARDAVTDFIQIEDGGFATEAIPTTSARSAEYLSRPAADITGQIRLELRVRPKGDRNTYTGNPRLFTFGTGSDQAYLDPTTGQVTVIVNGTGYTTTLGVTWSANDTVDFWVRAGGTLETTTVMCRVNNGATQILGVNGSPQGNHTGSGTFHLLNNKAVSDVFSCWVEKIVAHAVGSSPAWALEPARYSEVTEWLDPYYGITGYLATAWTAKVGASTYTATSSNRPAVGPGYIELDGSATKLAKTADVVSHPGGATKATICGWLWTDDKTLLQVPWGTSNNSFGLYYQLFGGDEYAVVGGGFVARAASTPRNATWCFVAMVFDGTLSVGSRIKLYRSEDATSFTVLVTSPSTEPTVVPAANGNSEIGDFPGIGRFWKGRHGHRLLYAATALTAAEIAQTAQATKPVHMSIICDGNSLTSGDGSTNGQNYPTQLAGLLARGTLVQNYGVSGQQVSQMVSDFASQVTPQIRPASLNILVAWEVGNSIYFGASARSAVDQFWAYCDTARAAGFTVYVLTLTYRSNISGASIIEANGYLRSEWVSHAAGLVDVGADTRLDHYDATYFNVDQIHLNNTGYAIVAGLVAATLPATSNAGTPNPEAYSNLRFWFDPSYGTTLSGGLITSYVSRVGAATLTASGGARPTAEGTNAVSFSGGQSLSATATSLNTLAEEGKLTICGWQYLTGTANSQVIWTMGTYPNILTLYSINDVAPLLVAGFVGGTAAASSSVETLNTWAFVAMTFDGSLANGSKTKLYYGLTPGSVAAMALLYDNTTATVVPAANANVSIGDNVTGRLGSLYLYNTPLSLDQLKSVAAYKVPV